MRLLFLVSSGNVACGDGTGATGASARGDNTSCLTVVVAARGGTRASTVGAAEMEMLSKLTRSILSPSRRCGGSGVSELLCVDMFETEFSAVDETEGAR